jgi:tight adherence protein B
MPWYEVIVLVVLLAVMLVCARAWWFADVQPKQQELEPQTKLTSGIRQKLRLLDINLAPISVLIGILTLSICAYMAIHTAFPQHQSIAVIMALAILISSYFVLDDLVTWRIKRVETELVDAMDTMHSSLQAGLSPLQAISTAASLAKGPLKAESIY